MQRHRYNLAFARRAINCGVRTCVLCMVIFGGSFSYVGAATIEATPSNYLSVFTTLKPGDTCLLRGGTYTSPINNQIPGGTASAPITIKNYPGETVVFRPSVVEIALYLQGDNHSYITFDGFNIDGVNCKTAIKLDRTGSGGPAPHHFRFINAEVKNCQHTAFVPVYTSDYDEWINLNVHHNGWTLDTSVNTPGGLYHYGWYYRGSYGLIQGCNVGFQGSSGLQIYANNAATEMPVGNRIISNNFHDNCQKSTSQGRGAGIVLSTARNTTVSGNQSTNNRVGVFIDTGASNTQLTNNNWCNNSAGNLDNKSSSTSQSGNTTCGSGSATPPPPTSPDVTQNPPSTTQPPQQQPPVSQPPVSSGTSFSFPMIAGAVILGAFLLSD